MTRRKQFEDAGPASRATTPTAGSGKIDFAKRTQSVRCWARCKPSTRERVEDCQ